MVSGRFKAYEKEDKPADSLSNETSGLNYKGAFISTENPQVSGPVLCIGDLQISKRAIDDLVNDTKSEECTVLSVAFYGLRKHKKEEPIRPIEINGQKYIALRKVTRNDNHRQVTVYDYRRNKIREFKYTVSRLTFQNF